MAIATKEFLDKNKVANKIATFKMELYPLFIDLSSMKTKDKLFSITLKHEGITYKKKTESQSFCDVALKLDDLINWFNSN